MTGRVPGSVRTLLYAGKFSHSKGVPWLLDAIERLNEIRPDVVLHVAGTGAGAEADALRERMEAMAPVVELHGQVSQTRLSELMRAAHAFVLPSFYEGLPLVLVEAAACGCRIVATELPGVERELAPGLGALATWVPMPRLEAIDRPVEQDIPAFVDALVRALTHALEQPALAEPSAVLAEFSWSAVFARVAAVYDRLT